MNVNQRTGSDESRENRELAHDARGELLAGITAGVIGRRIRDSSGNKLLRAAKHISVNNSSEGVVFLDIDLGREFTQEDAQLVLDRAKPALVAHLIHLSSQELFRSQDQRRQKLLFEPLAEALQVIERKGVHLNSVVQAKLAVGDYAERFAVLDVECSDETLAELSSFANKRDSRGLSLAFHRSPRWRTRQAVRELEETGQLVSVEEVFVALSGQVQRENAENDSGTTARFLSVDGGPPFCTIDVPNTKMAEDALRAVALPSGEIYVAVHLPDARFPNRGFRCGQEVLTLGGGFLLGTDGIVKDVHFGRGVVRVQEAFSSKTLERYLPRADGALQRSVRALQDASSRISTSGRPPVTEESESSSDLVESVLTTAYTAFTHSFAGTGARFIYKAPRQVPQGLLRRLGTVLPGIEQDDFRVPTRLGAVLLNLFDLKRQELFQEVLSHVSSRWEYQSAPAEEILAAGRWARFKANGLPGLLNQKVALHHLGEGPVVSRSELDFACAVLNREAIVLRERMKLRNASLITNRRFHEARDALLHESFEAAVRRWDPMLGLVVELKDLSLAGAIHPLELGGKPGELPTDVKVVWEGIDLGYGIHRFRLAG